MGHTWQGFVKLRQLILGLSAICRGSEDEAITYTLRAFDRDGEDRISTADLTRLLGKAYKRFGMMGQLELREYVELLEQEMQSGSKFAQFSYLVRTEPILRLWLPLDEVVTPAALEHRAAVLRSVTIPAVGDPEDVRGERAS